MAALSTLHSPCLENLHGKPRVMLTGHACSTWFLGDEEVSYLYERASSSTLDEREVFHGLQIVQFDLPFNTATSRLSRGALIQACKTYEPAYSPDAGVTCNDFSCRVFQHQLQINETLSSTVTALMESAFPQGATIYRPLPVRPKLLTTGRMSTRSLNLSALQPKFLVGNITEKSIRCCVWSHSRRSLYAHTRALFSVLLPTNVLSSCELSKNCFGA